MKNAPIFPMFHMPVRTQNKRTGVDGVSHSMELDA
jgi:hypothetical protein